MLALAVPLLFPGGARAYDLFGEHFRTIDEVLAYDRDEGVRFLDRQGRFLGSAGENAGAAVPVDKMPKALLQALIAKEDHRFLEHDGLDYLGLARALTVAVTSGHFSQGGSTLTQQTMKNIFLKDEGRWTRKVREIISAQDFEDQVGKRNVLYLYLNRAYFGTGAYGVEAAARVYFNKPATDLTLKECALLVGLLPAPSRLNPFADAARAQEKAAVVLDAMVEAGTLTRAQAERAKRQRPALALTNRAAVLATGGFREVAKARFDRWRAARHGTGDAPGASPTFTVRTTLDRDLQIAAVRSLDAVMTRNAARLGDAQCALVALNDRGEVLALVGSRDAAARHDHFNRALLARRQPGSAFKLFVYLAALERGLTPSTPIDARRLDLGDGHPIRNFDDRYPQRLTLGEALARSSNTAAARLTLGHADAVADVARRLGIGTPLTPNLGLALGGSEVSLLELTRAYAAVANGGFKVEAAMFQSVRDPRGREIHTRTPPEPERVLAPSTAAAMKAMLGEALRHGTGRAASIGVAGAGAGAGGKTGTTNDYRDAWFIGFAGGLTVGVWVGHDDNTPMKGVSGGTVPAQVWRAFMTAATAKPRPRGPAPLRAASRLTAATLPGPAARR